MVQLALFPVEDKPIIVGDPELAVALRSVVGRGFPDEPRHASRAAVDVSWNRRLRSTVGRTIYAEDATRIEISPSYHHLHPTELDETLAHEYAHVLRPGVGHGPPWRRKLVVALRRLNLPVRRDLACSQHVAASNGRYVWKCPACGAVVATRSRRRRDEVASVTNCCEAQVMIIDTERGEPAEPRPYQVACRRCDTLYVAYDNPGWARQFARRHCCPCGGCLGTRELVG